MVPLPNIWTHILFADTLCEKIDREDLLNTSAAPLHVGAQGPDPFFYHNFWPFLPDDQVEEVGMKLHTEQCGPFLLDMIERGTYHKNPIQAFILGFVSHHILDRTTHPYIHYHAGYEENKHQELEVIIDTLVLNKYKGIRTWKTPVHKEIAMGHWKKPMTDLLESLIETHYPGISDRYPNDFVEKSYSHIRIAQRVLYDPWGWKNKRFSSLVGPFSHQPIEKELDYLNEQRTSWHHPATNEEMVDSFLDLYEVALTEGKQAFVDILSYWNDPQQVKWEKIKSIIGNVSYDTGKPLEENHTNQYSKPIV
ncbi:hypothetical protein HM131_15290 [Halobacillus mangrovi]|uniref:Phospholipase C/D domain-containing protein n=1 Tax=Halobacillus mangrovi TaxID=402384 RepID=A0A1W5ZY17_9BACI|nr:hypothetical protein HM131_15290 [Halobacillus mangrovi]